MDCMVWARNLLGFAVRQRFWKPIQLLMRFVGNISALFVVAGSHGLDTNPAAVRLFRKRSAKGFGRKGYGSSFSDIVRLMRFVGNISALFVVAVSHGLGTNPAAVRRLRKRSAKGLGR